MKNAELRTIPLVVALALGLVAAGCKDEEILHSCHELCKHRILCEEERGNPPPNQTSCETACLGIQGNDLIERSEECVNEASCDYVACVEP
ncbi:hypothetical protein SOCEGT47_055840 [Sorangium cellulosum]|uniref:Secreted protein n=1 Tax=Sorangium cellulosum TaxID=56 RepID=A0A4P2Q707_SORCE|nr:hypothetical protein [Sorangium cellulosum]AUX25041.1 hypothetical protein SOCEGT47_055840 [Sorangium cellulosum]